MEYRDRHGPDMLNGQVFTNEGLNGHGSLFKGGEVSRNNFFTDLYLHIVILKLIL
jgi:hypothetical protein